MSRVRLLLALTLVSTLTLAVAPQASAAVWSVLTIRVDGDPANWLALVKQVAAIRKNAGVQPVSVVQATFAGDSTGLFFVSAEYESLAALEAATAKVNADPAWPGLLKQLNAASTIVSSSLYAERTPAGVKPSPMPAGGISQGFIVRAPDTAAYLALVSRLAANAERLGNPVPSVWQATAAGEGTGSILLRTPYASLTALEAAQTKGEADAASQQLMRDFEATGRKVVARLIVRDRTPQ
jgi:hypothetical protein